MAKLLPKKDIKITVIGAGKIAHSLVPALLDKNYKIVSIYDVHIEAAAELAMKYNIKNYSDALFNFDPQTNIFILAVPDGEIKKVSGLLSLLDLDFTNCIVVHLSGSRNVRILDEVKNHGAYTASLHMMQTFPSKKKYSIKGTYAAIESEHAGVSEFLSDLATEIELVPFYIKSEEKVYYHLMGVMVSNFFAGNMYGAEMARELMDDSIPDLYKLLKPIVNSTFANVSKAGAAEALSGPIERGDFETVEMHVDALSNNHELQFHYISNSLSLLEIVNSKGKIPSREYGKIKLYLTAKLNELADRL